MVSASVAPPLGSVVVIAPPWGVAVKPVDLVLFGLFYAISGHGITVGFHRYFTHGSFKASRPLRIALALAGALAIQGPVTRWLADDRRPHTSRDADAAPPRARGPPVCRPAGGAGLGVVRLGRCGPPKTTSRR